jgi:hypothetical protein
MPRTPLAILLAVVAAASLPPAASALAISYVVDRTLSPSFGGGVIAVTGTVTVDDAGPTVTDWDITITSSLLGRSVTLDPGNSTFFSTNTTLTATATELAVDTGVFGLWGPQLRDDGTSLRHEWFLNEEQGFIEQASIDFADPDPDSDFVNVPRDNPTILLAVPEPATLCHLAVALAGLGTVRVRRRRPRTGLLA